MVEIAAGILRRSHRRRLGIAALAVAFLVAAAASLVFGRAVAYQDAILPGVRVADVEVGGLARADARLRIETVLTTRLAEPVTVAAGGQLFTLRPAELFEVDVAATERHAFEAGRESVWSRAVAVGLPFALDREVEPVVGLRAGARERISSMLADVVREPVAARATMVGFSATVRPASPGLTVDPSSVVRLVRTAALAGDKSVAVQLRRSSPAVSTRDAERAAAQAEAVVAAPVTVLFRGERAGTLSRRTLAKAVGFALVAGEYRVTLAERRLRKALTPMVGDAIRRPRNATFAVAGRRVRVVPSSAGTQVAVDRAAAAIVAAAEGDGPRRVAIALTTRPADLTTREARALGIRERVSKYTTLMGESSANRIWNVQLLGRYLDGTIVKPGQTFSFNKVMGPRTPERGFREGQMIFGGVLIPSIGGGVCQTATTIFNAAFEAGLPIAKRKNHSFYISHYPMGRDAAVSWGGPDLVFKNDLDNPILIKAWGDSRTFTVAFYGTKQGRRVVSRTSEPTNYTSPRLQYAIDPSAPPGSVRTTGGGGPGFDVTVSRTVYERGRVIRRDKFFTRYTPENPTAVYGAGSTPPGPYFTLPSA